MANSQAGEPLTFQGRRDYPIPDKVDDWGLTKPEQETKVEQFRCLCEAQGLWDADKHDYFTLLRFLRARNYEFDKALTMWKNHLEWRKENAIDDILDSFQFEEKENFLQYYPQGYHKTDKQGRPVYIQLLGKIDVRQLKTITTEERMVKFHVQEYERCMKRILPVCSKIQGRQVDQTFGIMDVKGVGMSHLSGEIKQLLTTITTTDQDNYPETLGHICIINAPSLFKLVWSLVKPLLNARTQGKIEILGTNYRDGLLRWIDDENLVDWLGGKSKGTLYDDCGPWSDPAVLAKLDMEHKPTGLPGLRTAASANMADSGGEDGYQSPKSDASFISATASMTDLGPSSIGLPRAPTGPTMSRSRPHEEGTSYEPLPNSSPGNTLGHVPSGVGPHSMDGGSVQFAPSGLGMATGAKFKPLVERIRRLEQQLPVQAQRLFVPPEDLNKVASTHTAPEGTVLHRVEILEEGMELLLRAQELSWQEKAAERSSCCSSACSIM